MGKPLSHVTQLTATTALGRISTSNFYYYANYQNIYDVNFLKRFLNRNFI
uniref:PRO1942 n=1 Tax=Homo sapiens TaxID=9606 RepID=Q9P1F9_HUMAN|nr:PRO1942 [Homo sapiens]